MSKDKKKKTKTSTEDSPESSSSSSSDDEELPADAAKISKDDYYNKSGEFMHWLRRKRKLYLEDLPSKVAKRHFKAFVRRWNAGRLNPNYYNGDVLNQSNSSLRTKFHWKFSDKLDNVEMGKLRNAVVTWTAEGSTPKQSTEVHAPPAATNEKPRRMIGPTMPPPSTYDKELSREEKKREQKRKDKQYKERKSVALDELLPKATGREAKLEKKIASSQHRKAKEQSPELPDSHVMGGSESIRSIVNKRNERTHKMRMNRAEKAKEKITAYEEREKEKMRELMELARASKNNESLW